MAAAQPKDPSKGPAQLLLRIVTAALLLPPLAAITWSEGPWFRFLASAVVLISSMELMSMALPQSPRLARWGSPLALAALPLFSISALASALFIVLHPSFLYLPLAALLLPRLLGPPLSNSGARWVLWTLGALVYLAAPLTLLTQLHEAPQGNAWLLWLLLVTFATDTAAYAVGRLLGQHPLAPRISPAKTREGALGGFLGGVLVAVGSYPFFGLPLRAAEAVVLGAGLAIAAQLGDLYESALKRRLSAKDASRLLPGHGGLLDRLDSILPSGLMLYYFLLWRGPVG